MTHFLPNCIIAALLFSFPGTVSAAPRRPSATRPATRTAASRLTFWNRVRLASFGTMVVGVAGLETALGVGAWNEARENHARNQGLLKEPWPAKRNWETPCVTACGLSLSLAALSSLAWKLSTNQVRAVKRKRYAEISDILHGMGNDNPNAEALTSEAFTLRAEISN
jgi:hypothetical protein